MQRRGDSGQSKGYKVLKHMVNKVLFPEIKLCLPSLNFAEEEKIGGKAVKFTPRHFTRHYSNGSIFGKNSVLRLQTGWIAYKHCLKYSAVHHAAYGAHLATPLPEYFGCPQ